MRFQRKRELERAGNDRCLWSHEHNYLSKEWRNRQRKRESGWEKRKKNYDTKTIPSKSAFLDGLPKICILPLPVMA